MYRRPSLLNDISALRLAALRRTNSLGKETVSAPTLATDASTASPTPSDYNNDTNHGGGGSLSSSNQQQHYIGGALSSSPIDEISAPLDRDLTSDELSELQELLRGTLQLTNCSCAIQAAEDATDLVNYACDLVDDKLTVGAILEELEFMELEICGRDSLLDMRAKLADYLGSLPGNELALPSLTNVNGEEEYAQDGRRRKSLQSELRESENHVATMDLSAKTSAAKKKEEMARLLTKGKSIKDRVAMYNDRTISSNLFEEEDGSSGEGEMNFKDEAEMNAQRERELDEAINDMSLTQKECTSKMKEVQAKYGLLKMKIKIAAATKNLEESSPSTTSDNNITSLSSITRAERELKPGKKRSSIDLSAKSAVVKKCQELAQLKRQGSSLEDRRTNMYNDDGTMKGTSYRRMSIDRKFLVDKDTKDTGDVRREELMKIMKDRTLSREEKASRMEEVRAMYPESGEDDTSPVSSGSSSTTGNHQEQENEGASPQAGEDIQDRAAPLPLVVQVVSKSRTELVEDERQHRSELHSIMKDRTLSSTERRQKREVAHWKAVRRLSQEATPATAATANTSEGTSSSSTSSGGAVPSPEELASLRKLRMDFSAKSYSERRRASLAALEGKNSMTLKERLAMYSSNESISNV